MEYRKGYVKALTDIYNLLERHEDFLKFKKINQTVMVRKIIRYCLEHTDEMMMYGEMIEFYYRIDDTGKGKNKAERTEIINPKKKGVTKYEN